MTTPEFRIGRGHPNEEELAALTALLCSLAAHPPHTATHPHTPLPAPWRIPASPTPRSWQTNPTPTPDAA
ncbi:acyl-CoA carboxylase subunit epsilon [Streptomyces sp. cmx-4-9]|uniref:acyl-CoA carboxylase subunit epsilon n=1 Tax=Streptomyces sp. cmx-4-9 TaxID=2790941 RepID=UPI003980EF3D